jgi:hypothetical protein
MGAKRQAGWKGMNWVRQEKRLALYLRDGLSCAYCGASVEDGARLTLDHIRPHSRGGSNAAANLVTCCQRCNSSRADRPVAAFARACADYLNHGVTADEIVQHVQRTRRRVLPMDEAREMIARRGSAARALAHSGG